jgi:phospholipid N-methyltransferase
MNEASPLSTPPVSRLAFFKSFIAAPSQVASVVPTFDNSVRRVCRSIDFSTARSIIEVGPGSGPFTRYLLSKLRPDARLLLIEFNADLANLLRRKFVDPRVTIHTGSATETATIAREHRFENVDCVLNGMPFSILTPPQKHDVMDDTFDVLAPGGQSIVYQFASQPFTPGNDLRPLIRQRFGAVSLRFTWFNVPPLSIYHATRAR